MIASLPAASTWETQCFISAAVVGVTVIGVVSTSIARRSTGMSTSRRVLLTVLMAVAFVAVLAYFFWAVEPCAQGPA
ncbi:MAG TPA: hypothetical protein VFW26_05740 [Gaiellales bacterium]|nr:hypothetical protein [Gaiellales bacterium]